jgi:small subunit ribosomal protein S17
MADQDDELTPDATGEDATQAADQATPDAQETAAEAGDGAPAAPAADELPPIERVGRRRARGPKTKPTLGPRTPAERQAERDADRRFKAGRRRHQRLKDRTKAAERRADAPPPEPLAPVHAPTQGARKVRQGIVVSDKADKTITVRVDVVRRHRRYEKVVRSVVESRPLSATKRWRLTDVLERAR